MTVTGLPNPIYSSGLNNNNEIVLIGCSFEVRFHENGGGPFKAPCFLSQDG